MALFSAINVSGSGLTAERLRMDLIAGNIANAHTTRTPEGGPFKRQLAVFSAMEAEPPRRFSFLPSPLPPTEGDSGRGVRVLGVIKDPAPPRLVYNPSHPDANEEGYVAMPNFDLITEMVDLISATRAYEANVTAINASKSMAQRALEIGRA